MSDPYPHLSQVGHEPTRSALRLLWDELARCQTQLANVQAARAVAEKGLGPLAEIQRRLARVEAESRG